MTAETSAFAAYAVDAEVARKLLATALSTGGDYADLFFEYRSGADFTYEEGRVKSVGRGISCGLGVRVIRGEGTGYPTQKPERLLERILRAATEPGETVADLMCGSGTTLAVAAQLDRRFVGGDRSEVALALTRKRLDARAVPYELVELGQAARA